MLTTQFCGISLVTPVIVASGPATREPQQLLKAQEYGAGAVVTKLIIYSRNRQEVRAFANRQARYFYDAARKMLVSCSDKRLTLREGLSLIRTAKRHLRIGLIGNIGVPGSRFERVEDWVFLAKAVAHEGVDLLELNVSCPHFMDIGREPEVLTRITSAVKSAVPIPIMVKLPPRPGSMALLAKACEEGGADALSAINSVRAIPMVSLEGRGLELFKMVRGGVMPRVMGPWVRPIALQCVAEVANATQLPIAGIGGIFDWKHAMEHILVGAKVVQLCTGVLVKGYEVVAEINRGLTEFLNTSKRKSISELVKTGLESCTTEPVILPMRARIIRNKCNGCGYCTRLGGCTAIRIEDGVAKIDLPSCMGCGLCASLCHANAIEYIQLSES